VIPLPADAGAACAPVCLAIEAMATRFELVLPCVDLPSNRGSHEIAQEALAEIARLESHLSCHQPASDVSWINAYAGRRAVKVAPALFSLLQRCVALSEATDGAFDITVGPLMRAWEVDPSRLAADARTRVGYRHLRLDPRASTIRFERPGMSIDLGAAGKGYAVDRAIEILRNHGAGSALLHGGTSSVHAVGAPPRADGWKIAWRLPDSPGRTVALRDRALSVSAPHGKRVIHGGTVFGHVLDPRTGAPVRSTSSALVTGPGSFECDALSTALLVLGTKWLPTLRARFPGYVGFTG